MLLGKKRVQTYFLFFFPVYEFVGFLQHFTYNFKLIQLIPIDLYCMLVATLGSETETEDRKEDNRLFCPSKTFPYLIRRELGNHRIKLINSVKIIQCMKHRLRTSGSHSGVLHNPFTIKSN